MAPPLSYSTSIERWAEPPCPGCPSGPVQEGQEQGYSASLLLLREAPPTRGRLTSATLGSTLVPELYGLLQMLRIEPPPQDASDASKTRQVRLPA